MDTLYHRVGGEPALDRIVDSMYASVLADPGLRPFFDGVQMPRQRAKFRTFLSTVLEGPVHRSGIELRAAHSKAVDSGLDHGHFDSFVTHLRAALESAAVQPDLANEVLVRLEHARADVLGL